MSKATNQYSAPVKIDVHQKIIDFIKDKNISVQRAFVMPSTDAKDAYAFRSAFPACEVVGMDNNQDLVRKFSHNSVVDELYHGNVFDMANPSAMFRKFINGQWVKKQTFGSFDLMFLDFTQAINQDKIDITKKIIQNYADDVCVVAVTFNVNGTTDADQDALLKQISNGATYRYLNGLAKTAQMVVHMMVIDKNTNTFYAQRPAPLPASPVPTPIQSSVCIEKHMDNIFKKGGLLEQIDPTRFQHRPAQYDFAIELGRYYDAPKLYHPKADIKLTEVGTGVGKTLPYVMVLALLRRLYPTNPRGLVTTFTRALREEIIEYNKIVNDVLIALGLQPIVISAIRSISSIASLDEAEAIVKNYDVSSPYYNKVVLYRDLIADAEDNGQLFYLTDWLDMGEDFGFHLEGRKADNSDKLMGSLSLSFREFERKYKEQNPAFTKFKDENDLCRYGADIVVVTHTMFVMSGMLLGAILNTNKKAVRTPYKKNEFDESEFTKLTLANMMDRFNLIIDEADQFTRQAASHFNTSFDVNTVRQIFVDAGMNVSPLVGKLTKALSEHPASFVLGQNYIFKTTDEEIFFIEEFKKLYDKLKELFIDDDKHRGKLYADRAVIVAESMRKMIDYHESRGSTKLIAAHYSNADIDWSITKQSNNNYRFSFIAKAGRYMVSRSWTNYNIQGFDTFVFMSGTMMDEKKNSASYCKMVGVPDTRSTGDVIIPTTGFAKAIVFCDSNAVVRNGIINQQSESNHPTRDLTEEFKDHICAVIKSASEKPSLILMTSYKNMEDIREKLPAHGFVIQNRGERSSDFVNRLKKKRQIDPNVSVICLFWSGVNFVDSGQTMFKRVVLPLIPFSPMLSTNNGAEITTNKLEAYWKMKQGFGRIFRNPFDQDGEIWIGDPRFGLNSRYSAALSGKYTGGKKRFDSLFDDVQLLRNNSLNLAPTIIQVWSDSLIIHKGKL